MNRIFFRLAMLITGSILGGFFGWWCDQTVAGLFMGLGGALMAIAIGNMIWFKPGKKTKTTEGSGPTLN